MIPLGVTAMQRPHAPTAHIVHVRVSRESAQWRVFPPPQGDEGIYVGIVNGPDGAVWLTDYRGRLVRVDPHGTRSSVPLRFTAKGMSHAFLPAYVTVGVDSKFYLTGCVDDPTNCAVIGVADTQGHLKVYAIPSGDGARFSGIATGGDGNVWFTDAANVGEISPNGSIHEYRYPSGETTNELSGIARGPNGHMWFTEVDTLMIGNVDIQSGKIVEFSTAAQNIDCGLSGMAAGPDGNMYTACGTGFLSITPGGTMRSYSSDFTLSDGAQEIAKGVNGMMWFQFLRELGRYDASQQLLVLYKPPGKPITLYGSVTASDSSQWTLAQDGTLYVLPARHSGS